MKTRLHISFGCASISFKTCLEVVHVMFRFLMPIMQSYVPSQAKEKDVFYLTPNDLGTQSKPWYSLVPVSRNHLGSMLKVMCAEVQVSGHFTNYSLRYNYYAYDATTLNLSEKLIQERTSCWCFKALRLYERTSDSQWVEVSKIISSNKVQAPAMSSVSWTKMEIREQDKVHSVTEVKWNDHSYAAIIPSHIATRWCL